MILPYLEEGVLFGKYNRREAWDSEGNHELLKYIPQNLAQVEDAEGGSETRLRVFTGKGTPFEPPIADDVYPRGPTRKDIVDGVSRTIMIVRASKDHAVPWTEPRDIEFDEANPLAEVVEGNEGGIPVVMFDGRATILSPDIDPQVFKSMVLKDDGQ